MQAKRLRRDGRRSQAFRDQPLAAQRFGDQPANRRRIGTGTGRLDRAGSPLRRADPDDQVVQGAPAAKPSKPKPSLAATPPPAVKKGEKDIFDDTDFEVDVPSVDADSDDKTVQLEAASDFDLEDSDTGSEVFAIDEEAVDQNASTAMAPSAFAEDDEDEEDDGFDSAVSSEMTAGWSSSESSTSPERSSPAMVLSRESETEWSGLWVGMLGVTTLFLFFASFVAYDMVRNLYEFQSGGTMGSGLVRAIAGMFGGLIDVEPARRRTSEGPSRLTARIVRPTGPLVARNAKEG